jgi:hypothetical protein
MEQTNTLTITRANYGKATTTCHMPNQSSSFVCGGDKGTITPERKESAKDDV